MSADPALSPDLSPSGDGGPPRILFVDDEENVLRGIRRMLRAQRGDWQMDFVSSAEEALNYLENNPVDVVVSDMRMPGMDGATFLGVVQEKYPQAIRIVLSGFAEKEMILKTIGPSHLYLAKPCDQDILVKAINRSLALRRFVHSESLTKMVSGIPSLPSLPGVFLEILQELDNELVSVDTLAGKIAQDIGVASQLMRLTNSAYFSLPQKASTPRQAINLLGFENVKAVVLLSGVVEPLLDNMEAKGVLETLTRRSLQIGILAQQLARADRAPASAQEMAFCAGLLAHVGTLLLVCNWPDKFDEAVRLIELDKIPISEAEMRVFGTTHAKMGAYLMGLWGFSDEIVEAIAYHHKPIESEVTEDGPLLYVHVAQHLLRVGGIVSPDDKQGNNQLDQAFLHRLRVKERLPAWQKVYHDICAGWDDG